MVALFYNEDGIRAIDELLKECKRFKGNEKENPFFAKFKRIFSFYHLRILSFGLLKLLFFRQQPAVGNRAYEELHHREFPVQRAAFREAFPVN